MRIEQLRAELGCGVLMVSHDLAVVTHLCQRLAVMQRGHIVETLASADLAAQQVRHDYTRSLMQAAAGFRRGAGATPTLPPPPPPPPHAGSLLLHQRRSRGARGRGCGCRRCRRRFPTHRRPPHLLRPLPPRLLPTSLRGIARRRTLRVRKVADAPHEPFFSRGGAHLSPPNALQPWHVPPWNRGTSVDGDERTMRLVGSVTPT